jgi:hypothetical protein
MRQADSTSIVISRQPILSVRHSVALAIGIVLVHRLIMAATANDIGLRADISDGIAGMLTLFIAAGLFYVARCSKEVRHIQIAWCLLGVGLLIVVLGTFIYVVIGVPGQTAFPTISDGFFILFYPVFGAGLLLMPGANSTGERVKMLLDIAIVMMTAILVFGIILIPPILSTYAAKPLAVFVALAYPIGDGVLFFAVLRMLFSPPGHVHPISLLLLAIAGTGQVIYDLIYLSETFSGAYVSGNWVDTLEVATLSIFIVVIAFQVTHLPSKTASWTHAPNALNRQFGWAVYVPLIGIVVAYLLLAWAHDHVFPLSFQLMAWVVGGIIGLAFIRQIVLLQENTRLNRQLEKELIERKAAE